FGTGQTFNWPLYNRPSIGSTFTINTSMKNGATDTLWVNGASVLSEGGKLLTIANCQSLCNIGRGYNDNTFYNGDIAEIFVYKRALTTGERTSIENYLANKYFPTP